MTEDEYITAPDDLIEEELDELGEIYDQAPDFDVSQTLEDDSQDDDSADTPVGLTFFAKVVASTRNWRETLAWYATHHDTGDIGFNPDGMCLKVCRTARNIQARYLTAKEAQDATPKEFRVYKISDIRKTMIAYFDDVNDSNRAGHIVTAVGRVKGFDPNDLNDIIFETNSVVSGKVVRVRGGYFKRYWGDDFKFATTWLNGVEFDVPGKKSKVERFNNGGPVYDLNLLAKAGKHRPKPAQVLDRIEAQVKRLPDAPALTRVREFKEEWRDSRKIDLSLLDAAVKSGRTGLVKKCRDEIRRLIDTLPDE